MSNTHVGYEEREDASVVVIDRPQVHNALATETLRQLQAAVARGVAARSAAIVITGAGGRAFSAGGDLGEIRSATPAAGRVFLGAFLDLLLAIRRCPKPVIARVDGYCLGGGNELAITCDLTIASDRSTFGVAGASVGTAPLMAATQLMPRIVGEKRARELVLLCERHTAAEALELGWINKVVPSDQLDGAVEAWCKRLAAMSPQSLRIAKASMNAGADTLLPSLTAGVEMLAAAFGTEELAEGVAAFLEKRAPDFRRFRA